jgi:alpha/beta superfamily hydrolase
MLPLWNHEATFRVIEGADHFYLGYEDEIKSIIRRFLGASD